MKRLVWLIVVAAAGAAGWWYWQSHGSAGTNTANAQKGRASVSRGGAPIAITTAQVEQADFPVIVRTIGWVESPAVVQVRSRIDSQVMEQHVQEGQFVNKGDLLFVLDDRPLKAQLQKDQAALMRDEAVHARTQTDRKRKEELLPKGAATQQQVDQAVSDERSAAATVAADQAAIEASQLNLSYARIYAPISGRVGAITVTPGNLVSANAGSAGTTNALVTITQINPIRATFSLAERYLPAIKNAIAAGAPLPVRLYTAGAKQPTAIGKLDFFDSSVDISSGTITAKATVDNDKSVLWPGEYVDVEVVINTLNQVAVVPTVAVQPGQQGSFVYVVQPNSTVEMRPIKIAASDADHTAVESGVTPGERVVTEGQLSLSNGAKVREPQPGEAHPERTSAASAPSKTGSID